MSEPPSVKSIPCTSWLFSNDALVRWHNSWRQKISFLISSKSSLRSSSRACHISTNFFVVNTSVILSGRFLNLITIWDVKLSINSNRISRKIERKGGWIRLQPDTLCSNTRESLWHTGSCSTSSKFRSARRWNRHSKHCTFPARRKHLPHLMTYLESMLANGSSAKHNKPNGYSLKSKSKRLEKRSCWQTLKQYGHLSLWVKQMKSLIKGNRRR